MIYFVIQTGESLPKRTIMVGSREVINQYMPSPFLQLSTLKIGIAYEAVQSDPQQTVSFMAMW